VQRALIAALFAALTIVMTWPVGLSPAGVRMGGGADPSLYVWTIGWVTHALSTAPWAVFDANIFYPYPNTLAYSENLIGSGLLALPIMWTTHDPLMATNLVAVLSVFLCAVGGYYLGRTLGLSREGAFLCGLIFAFAPPRFARLSQLHLAVHWVPFGLAFLHRYLVDPQPRHLRWALVLLSLQALTSGHGAALLLLGGLIMTLVQVVYGWRPSLAILRHTGLPGVIALAPAALAFIPYWLARRDVPLERVYDDVGITWSSYISSPTYVHQAILARLPAWEWLTQAPDAYLFPGILTLFLTAVAVFRRPTRDIWVFLLMTLVTWWITVGPPLSPWQWIYWMPGFNFIRVPSRFTLLGMLGLAVVAGFGFDRLARQWPRSRRRLAAAGVAVLCIGEFAMMPVDARPFTIDIAAVDRWLDTQPKPFAIAEVPVSASPDDSRRADVATQYMLHSLAHHQRTVFGYSGAEPETYRPLYDALIGFPSDESIRKLLDLKVTFVVVHLEYFTEEYRPEYLARLAAFHHRLDLAHEAGLGRVYRLRE
jgi:hypothetical protein